jgi:hypothetical protein
MNVTGWQRRYALPLLRGVITAAGDTFIRASSNDARAADATASPRVDRQRERRGLSSSCFRRASSCVTISGPFLCSRRWGERVDRSASVTSWRVDRWRGRTGDPTGRRCRRRGAQQLCSRREVPARTPPGGPTARRGSERWSCRLLPRCRAGSCTTVPPARPDIDGSDGTSLMARSCRAPASGAPATPAFHLGPAEHQQALVAVSGVALRRRPEFAMLST